MLKGSRSDRDGARSVLESIIKVLVVDHNKNLLNSVTDLHSFEVTWVEDAGAALRILSVKKDKFDLLLIDSDLKDVDAITFLRLTKNKNMLSMVMREEADDNFLLKMIKNGAFLVIRKPPTDDVLFQARQHVIRGRIHKSKMLDESIESVNSAGNYRKDNFDASRKKNVRRICYNNTAGNSDDIQLLDDDDDDDDESCINSTKKKICLEWTEELHNKFLCAVLTLGEGRCLPRDIVDTMKVPGLTRMQVASHLQKCREDGWSFNGKRGKPSSSKDSTFSSNNSQELVLRRFGRMPSVARHVDNQEEGNTHIIDATYSSNGVNMNSDHMNNQISHDSSLMNGFEVQNSGQVYSVPSAGQGCDSALMNGFGLQNSGQVFSVPSSGQGSDSSSMNDFGLQNSEQVFSVTSAEQGSDSSLMSNSGHEVFTIPSSGQGCDSSLMNGFGLQNSGQPNAEQGSGCHMFSPNQASDDLFDFWNDIDEDASLACMQFNVLGTNYDSISEPIYTYYDQVMPNQGTSLCNNQISQKVGEGNV